MYTMTNTVYGCAAACDVESECTSFEFDGSSCVLSTSGVDSSVVEAAGHVFCYVNARAADAEDEESDAASRHRSPRPWVLAAFGAAALGVL